MTRVRITYNIGIRLKTSHTTRSNACIRFKRQPRTITEDTPRAGGDDAAASAVNVVLGRRGSLCGNRFSSGTPFVSTSVGMDLIEHSASALTHSSDSCLLRSVLGLWAWPRGWGSGTS